MRRVCASATSSLNLSRSLHSRATIGTLPWVWDSTATAEASSSMEFCRAGVRSRSSNLPVGEARVCFVTLTARASRPQARRCSTAVADRRTRMPRRKWESRRTAAHPRRGGRPQPAHAGRHRAGGGATAVRTGRLPISAARRPHAGQAGGRDGAPGRTVRRAGDRCRHRGGTAWRWADAPTAGGCARWPSPRGCRRRHWCCSATRCTRRASPNSCAPSISRRSGCRCCSCPGAATRSASPEEFDRELAAIPGPVTTVWLPGGHDPRRYDEVAGIVADWLADLT